MPKIILTLIFLFTAAAQAQVFHDDLGDAIELKAPARRIVSLAPHLTELLFAAGLGDRLVGAVSYSDYPPAARAIPRVGGYDNLDIERIASLAPDLIVGWREGNHPAQLAQLRRLGFAVYVNNPQILSDIADTLEGLGALGGGSAQAERAAADFRRTLAALQARYANQPPIRVFYQVWHQPLMSASDRHLIGQVIGLCGGRNVFGAQHPLTPTISVEAVLQAAPEVIIASGMDEQRPDWLDEWERWPQLPAVRRGNLFFIPPDLLQRHGLRILDGARKMCEQLALARSKHASSDE